MWKSSEIDPKIEYVLQLCQDTAGKRTIRLSQVPPEPQSDVVFVTNALPHTLLKLCNLNQIAKEVRIFGGREFEFDAHGIWFTREEMDALDDDMEVPWCTKLPPSLPPK